MIVIRCADLAGFAEHPDSRDPSGLYLKAYDPEAHEGRGTCEWTDNLLEAIEFATTGEAWQLWRTIPKARPWRLDGKPNRPLTAFSIEVFDA